MSESRILFRTLIILCLFIPSFPALLYSDKALDDKVAKIVSSMTLEEKIGQMTQVDKGFLKDSNDIKTYFLGSLLSGGDSNPVTNTPEAWADMIDGYQALALQTRLKIPMIYGIDALHGNNRVYSAVIFPHNIGMGATRDPSLAEQEGRITALECAGIGAYMTFAPCVAIARDIRWGRTYESFSEDPEIVSEMGAAFLKGLQGTNLSDPDSILGCPKHYLGEGGTKYGTGTTGGNDQGDTEVDEKTLRSMFLKPYIAAVNAGAKSIMVSYSSWNWKKMSGNKYLLTDVLKGELKFGGFLISDWNAVGQLPGNHDDAIASAINAGLDMNMVSGGYIDYINSLKSLVLANKVPMSRIDDAVTRILKVKFEMGIFEHPYTDRKLTALIGAPERREIARQAVRESLVLLKNDGNFLPLSKNIKKILVAGKGADNIALQCGGWTLAWQGGYGNITPGTSILQAVKNAVSKGTAVKYSQYGDAPGKYDAVIAVIGEHPYAEYRGDILPGQGLSLDYYDTKTMENINKINAPRLVILLSGRPMILNDVMKDSKAFIAAWLPGTEGEGIADVIFGDYAPTGKLSFAWPKDFSQVPTHKDDTNYDSLYPFGYGLTY
jgi:beta-glucosidase